MLLATIAIRVAAFGLIKRSLTPPPAIDGCWEGVFGMLGYATLTGSYPESTQNRNRMYGGVRGRKTKVGE